MRLFLVLLAVVAQAAASGPTDLDRFMALALQRRDADRRNLSDYVLDEVESFEVLGPGRVPYARTRREYTWYVRDGIHVRSPLEFDGVPISEPDRRAYEERWVKSEQSRRENRTRRDQKREQEGRPPMLGVPSVNEPRFISESYFMDFKFEPGNYYLAGKESLDGQAVLKVDYLPSRLFEGRPTESEREDRAARGEPDAKDARGNGSRRQPKSAKGREPERDPEIDIDRKLDKTSQVTLWVDPATHQIVRYTFDNVWMDFLPAGWLVRIDDLRAQMQMGQPFTGVWLPKNVDIHAGLTFALGSMALQYRREFSNYRKADVTSRIRVPK